MCLGGNLTSPDKCLKYSVCGNGFREASEQCDDGNSISGDGCSSLCAVEPGYMCLGGTLTTIDKCLKLPVCGNGLRETLEQCDDGNTISGDGCSSLCISEPGYVCAGGSLSSPDKCLK